MNVWTGDAMSPSTNRCASCEHKHQRQPQGYLQWHAWAERKSRRHEQVRCATCGYLVWRRKALRG